jgi:hypothetical protein
MSTLRRKEWLDEFLSHMKDLPAYRVDRAAMYMPVVPVLQIMTRKRPWTRRRKLSSVRSAPFRKVAQSVEDTSIKKGFEEGKLL